MNQRLPTLAKGDTVIQGRVQDGVVRAILIRNTNHSLGWTGLGLTGYEWYEYTVWEAPNWDKGFETWKQRGGCGAMCTAHTLLKGWGYIVSPKQIDDYIMRANEGEQ